MPLIDLAAIGGRGLAESERSALPAHFGSRAEAHLRDLAQIPVVGANLRVDAADDKSGHGAEIRVLDPSQIEDEAMHAYPGKAALALESFLEDPLEYAALDALWDQLARRLAGDFARQPWVPWLRATFADGRRCATAPNMQPHVG